MITLNYRLTATDYLDHSTAYAKSGIRFFSADGEINLYISDVLKGLFSTVRPGEYYELVIVTTRTHELLSDVLDLDIRLFGSVNEYDHHDMALRTYYASYDLSATLQIVPLERFRPFLPDKVTSQPVREFTGLDMLLSGYGDHY